METKHTFACAINCMDGRIQDAVKHFMKIAYGVDYVDMVTEPGTNRILAEKANTPIVENIRKRLEISAHHHGSKFVAVVGHFGCAGNPTEKEVQVEHLREAKKTVEAFGLGVEVVPLWVNGDWVTVEKIS